MRLCLSALSYATDDRRQSSTRRRPADSPLRGSAFGLHPPPPLCLHSASLLLCFSYATDDRPTLPSAIPPPAFTHRLWPNQHRLPSAFAHRLQTSTATLAGKNLPSSLLIFYYFILYL
nr:hypothetical protein Iba_chr06cCG12900 [Ipomoea batatas]